MSATTYRTEFPCADYARAVVVAWGCLRRLFGPDPMIAAESYEFTDAPGGAFTCTYTARVIAP